MRIETLWLSLWLDKKLEEHKNKPQGPPQEHPKGCGIACLLFFLISCSVIAGTHIYKYYRQRDRSMSDLMELYAQKEYCSSYNPAYKNKHIQETIEIIEDYLFDWDVETVREQYKALPHDHNPRKKWREEAERMKQEQRKKLQQ